MKSRLTWLLASLVLHCGVSLAEPHIVVVRDDTAVARQVAEQLSRHVARLGWSGSELSPNDRVPGELRRDDSTWVVALGSGAIQTIRQFERPVVVALVTRNSWEESPPPVADRSTVIVLDQPPERWANLVRIAFPERRRVGLLAGPVTQKSTRTLERRFQDRRLTLMSEAVATGEAIVPALERLLPYAEVLLALPDALVHSRSTVQPLLLTTYRASVPVVAYSEAYLNAGATISLHSTIGQISAQVVETLQQLSEGRIPPPFQWPRYYTVGVNRAVARSLGLALPSDGDLLERLRAADQPWPQ